jgi:co-chaperonin GroES (HSP10)
MAQLVPVGNNVLVQLSDRYKGVASIEKKFDSRTSGVIVSVSDGIEDWSYNTGELSPEKMVGHKIYFEEYVDSARVEHEGMSYAFIAWDKIKGYLGE